MDTVRIDKWLWAARFFKTRALAVKACELGRVLANGVRAKAAREVRVGERIAVTTEAATFEVDVLAVSDVRGPAPVAQALYRETDASRSARAQAAAERKAMFSFGAVTEGKPSKRDRQQLARLRGRG